MRNSFLQLMLFYCALWSGCPASPRLYVVQHPGSLAEQALILSIQGLNAKDSDDRIWIDPGREWFDWPGLIGKEYGYEVVDLAGQPGESTTAIDQAIRLAGKCGDSYNGYILCDLEGNPDSLYVALSLAGPVRMLVVDVSIREKLSPVIGGAQFMDLRDAELQAILDDHADKLCWEGIAYPNAYDRISSADWCILHNWPIFFTEDKELAEAFMEKVEPNSQIITWHPPYEITGPGAPEDRFISYFSQRGLSVIPGVLMQNLSTLSGIARLSGEKPLSQGLPELYRADHDKHYVAFFLNSGGNLGYLHGRYLIENNRGNRSNWMNQTHDFPVSFSMSLAAVDFSPVSLRKIYAMKQEQDCFVTPFSGHSYIHPSQYKELDGFVDKLDHYLSATGQHIVAIQENKMVEIDHDWLNRFGSKYLDVANVRGLFVMNQPWGRVLWHNNKPVITKRFGMRIGGKQENIAALAANLNKQEADIHSENGYSIIHVDLEQTSFADMQQLLHQLAPHIQVVNLEELVYHVTRNVPVY